MDKIKNLELLAETIRRLTDALGAAHKGEDPQLLLIETLVPLQLHLQREALRNAKLDIARNALGYSVEQIDEAIALINNWLTRLDSDNIVEAYEAAETFRMLYSPIRLLEKLQALESKKRL
jgi:Leucine-rich repeat (LRR) protein